MLADSHLDFLSTRRTVRKFEDREVDSTVIERLLQAAVTAPSSSNRQPWRFCVVKGPTRDALAQAARARAEAIEAAIATSHHAADYGRYGDHFWEPLSGAAVVIVPYFRAHPDLLAKLIRSGGHEPEAFLTPAAMQPELASTSAAVFALLLQAHAEGLGAAWMAGPTIARSEFDALLGMRSPWTMLGAIALGWPAETPSPKPRKSLEQVVKWID